MGAQISSYFASGLGQITAFLPSLIAAVAIFAVGYIVARLLGALVTKLLARARFDQFVTRHLRPGAREGRPLASRTLGSVVFWVGMLVTLSLASQALRLAALSAGINRIVGYLPRVLVAAIIVGVAIPVARVASDLVANMSNSWLAKSVRVAIIAIGAFMAIDQLGVASGIVTALFVAVIAAVAAAAAIAFGVGSIDVAREYAHAWKRQAESRPGRQRRGAEEGREMYPTGGVPPPGEQPANEPHPEPDRMH